MLSLYNLKRYAPRQAQDGRSWARFAHADLRSLALVKVQDTLGVAKENGVFLLLNKRLGKLTLR